MQRVCANDPGHVETQPIPKLDPSSGSGSLSSFLRFWQRIIEWFRRIFATIGNWFRN